MTRLIYVMIALSVLVFGAMNVVEHTYLRVISGGLPSPDLRVLGYSFGQLEEWREFLGANGAAQYIKFLPHGLDLVFPALFGLTLMLIVQKIFNRFQTFAKLGSLTKAVFACALVLPYVVFDYFENGIIVDYLTDPAFRTEGMANLASSITILKFASLTLCLVVCLVFWVAGARKNRAAES